MNLLPWTEERDAALTLKWNAGLSAARIGADLNATKNAVTSRAKRIGLPLRESPIRARDPNATTQPKRLTTLPGLSRTGTKSGPLERATLVALGVAPAAAPAPEPAITFTHASRPCCWPIGEPRTPEFRYCDAPGIPGRSYCAGHHAVAYQPRVERSKAQIATDRARAAQYASRHRQSPLTKWGW